MCMLTESKYTKSVILEFLKVFYKLVYFESNEINSILIESKFDELLMSLYNPNASYEVLTQTNILIGNILQAKDYVIVQVFNLSLSTRLLYKRDSIR